MALSDCSECWSTPCVCGHDYQNWSVKRKNELVSAIMGYNVDELFDWLESKDYLTDSKEQIKEEFKNRKK